MKRERQTTDETCCAGLAELVPDGFFKALADPVRLAIIERLARCGCGSLSVQEIASCCPRDLSVVSRHLAILRQARVVQAERRGRQVLYRLAAERLPGILRAVADTIENCCVPRPVERDEKP